MRAFVRARALIPPDVSRRFASRASLATIEWQTHKKYTSHVEFICYFVEVFFLLLCRVGEAVRRINCGSHHSCGIGHKLQLSLLQD